MDPNAALTELRNLAVMLADADPGSPQEYVFAARMAEVFKGLDGWISAGGFLPADWQRGR